MTGHGRIAIAALLLAAAAQAAALDARMVARVVGDGPFWVGQRIVVELDLLTTGASFSGQRFEIPDLQGVVTLPPGSAVLNLTETIDGQSWSGLRYQLSLFVLTAGTLEVPPITAQFAVAAGFGGTPQPFRLDSAPLTVEVATPAGVGDAATLVTTPRFELETSWAPPADGLEVGDALTLTLRRRAVDVPGAALPPLEFQAPDGIAVYPAEPEIGDRTGRGTLTGERVDRVTFMLQSPGQFVLPGRSLEWYEPGAGILHEETLAPLEFTVAPGPEPPSAGTTRPDVAVAGPGRARVWLLLAAVAVLALGALAWARAAPRLLAARRRRRDARAASEAGCYAALQAACRRSDPRDTDRRLRTWVRTLVPRTVTPTAFAAGDPALAAAVAELQSVLAAGSERWSGASLAAALRHARDALRSHRGAARHEPLPPLNPGTVA